MRQKHVRKDGEEGDIIFFVKLFTATDYASLLLAG